MSETPINPDSAFSNRNLENELNDSLTYARYPSVQRNIDQLDAHSQEVDHTESGEPVLTPEIVNTWAKEMGIGNGKRGTFHNDDIYVYIKYGHIVDSEADVDEAMAKARLLTNRGAIHPESQWKVFKQPSGTFQLFVVSPHLEAWSLDRAVSGAYDERPVKPERDGSHMIDWFHRVDPAYVPGQPIANDSLLHNLNWTEASNDDNWGWDASGTLFPVDVEVLDLSGYKFNQKEPWL